MLSTLLALNRPWVQGTGLRWSRYWKSSNKYNVGITLRMEQFNMSLKKNWCSLRLLSRIFLLAVTFPGKLCSGYYNSVIKKSSRFFIRHFYDLVFISWALPNGITRKWIGLWKEICPTANCLQQDFFICWKKKKQVLSDESFSRQMKNS